MHSKRRTLFLYVFNEGETFVDGRAKTYANILFYICMISKSKS